MPSSFVRSRSTRRTATVTTSAPDASIASIICAFDAYLPVPTIRRERNSRPAITKGCGSASVAVSCAPAIPEIRSACAIGISAPAHEVHDLDRVVGGELERCKGGAVAKDGPIALDDHGARVETQRRKEFRKSPTGWDAPLFTVHSKNDLCSDRFRHRRHQIPL